MNIKNILLHIYRNKFIIITTFYLVTLFFFFIKNFENINIILQYNILFGYVLIAEPEIIPKNKIYIV